MTRGVNDGHVVKHPPTPNPLPLKGGKGSIGSSPLPVGEGWVRALFPYPPYNHPFLRNHQSGTTAEMTMMIRAIG